MRSLSVSQYTVAKTFKKEDTLINKKFRRFSKNNDDARWNRMQELDRSTWEHRVSSYRANVQENEEDFTVGRPFVFCVMSAVAVRTVKILTFC